MDNQREGDSWRAYLDRIKKSSDRDLRVQR